MAHVRQQLREAIKAQLVAGVSLVIDQNITCGRVKPFQTEDIHSGDLGQFPAINLVTSDEQTDGRFIGSCSRYKVDQTVFVEIYVKNGDDYESELDGICVEAHKAIESDPKYGLELTGTAYAGSKSSQDLSEGLFASRVLEYTVSYRVNHTDPESFS